jgi:hypothetical protein
VLARPAVRQPAKGVASEGAVVPFCSMGARDSPEAAGGRGAFDGSGDGGCAGLATCMCETG